MKETIKFYYDTYIKELYEINNGYYFYLNNYKYYFIEFNRDIREIDILFKLSNELYNKNILVDTFILNKDNKVLTNIQNKNYVLLRVNSIENDKYNLKDIIKFNNLYTSNTKIEPWSTLWINKIDAFEEKISELNNDYPIIQSSFDYYIGLAENAISYVNDTFIEENNFKINLNHKRIKDAYQGYVNNPLTFTFDYRVRDIAEYIKYNYFNNTINYDEIEEVILNSDLNKGELRLLVGRLLYPSYYLDTIKDIFIYEKNEEELNKYINKINDYELFLQDIYITIKRKYEIPPIEWLVNKK
mgnify:CR=1 FL=1